MNVSRMACTITMLVIGGMVVSCGDSSNPTAPINMGIADKITGDIIFSEDFESNLETNYKQITYSPGQGMMSISKKYAHSGAGSLTSDSNNTGVKRVIDPSMDDSIAGLQFYMMATKKSQVNTFVAISRPGSSANGLFTIMGMGISKSDSLQYIYENAPDDPQNIHKNFAALETNKWYQCRIEYNYDDTTLTYYLDSNIVKQMVAPSPMTLSLLVAMRDNAGKQGASDYYIDDIKVYKR